MARLGSLTCRMIGRGALRPPATSRMPASPARLPLGDHEPDDGGSVPLDFTAIDFETANSSNASACAVGLARVRDGRVVATAGWLIQPPPGHDRFFELNTRIHGLRAEDVADAKTWSEQLDDLAAFAGTDVLVAHNAGFDMMVLRRACEATGDRYPAYRYVCSLQVARKLYDLESYRLPSVAAAAGFLDFAHHDATADALACAHIMIDAAERVGARDIEALTEAAGVRTSRIVVAEQPGHVAQPGHAEHPVNAAHPGDAEHPVPAADPHALPLVGAVV